MAASNATSSSSPASQKLLRITILTYKSPRLSEAEFHHHWSHVHAPLASTHLAKFGIVSYRQYHTPRRLNEPHDLARELFAASVLPMPQADYDGFVELLMSDLECWRRAREDAYYEAVVRPDEEYFADMARSRLLVGWEEVYVADGKVVGVGG